jgi:hypothetical protein
VLVQEEIRELGLVVLVEAVAVQVVRTHYTAQTLGVMVGPETVPQYP